MLRQNVNYWPRHPLKMVQRKKNYIKYIERIIKFISNKTTCSISSAKITYIINKMLKINKEDMSIHKSTICRILNKEFGRPRNVKWVFYLAEAQKSKE